MSAILAAIQRLAASGQVVISQHAHDRFSDNQITTREVVDGVGGAAIVEDYPDYHKGPAVLVLQIDGSGAPIHVLWGLRKDTVDPAVIVTAYRPDPAKWSDDFRSRR